MRWRETGREVLFLAHGLSSVTGVRRNDSHLHVQDNCPCYTAAIGHLRDDSNDAFQYTNRRQRLSSSGTMRKVLLSDRERIANVRSGDEETRQRPAMIIRLRLVNRNTLKRIFH